jgi:shikimate kinase
LQASATGRDLVVALGGGAFVNPANREALERAGAITVLLEAPLDELRRRCGSDAVVRPLAKDEKRFADLFQARQAAYRLARYSVNTLDKAVDDVAAEVEGILTATMPEVKK